MQDSKPPQHTERRGNQWWCRRRVPRELVQLIGRAEYRESPRTSEINQARTKAALRDAEVTLDFERANQRINSPCKAPSPEEQPQSLRTYHLIDKPTSGRR